MSAQIDFLALYRELGIDPTCSPEAFKHAYRRRVSELHPDRGSDVVGPGARGGGADAGAPGNLPCACRKSSAAA